MTRLRTTPCSLSLIACSILAACGSSPPTRYYTLSVLAPDARANANGPSSGTLPVRLESVAIPAELDRLGLVSHSGANEVHVADSDQWAAPLDEQIRRTLSDDLAARLPEGMVADPNEPSTHDPRRTLSISIGHFNADATCAVTLSATWSLQTPHAADQSGSQRVEQPATGTCPAALPAAMSRALAALADHLVPVLLR